MSNEDSSVERQILSSIKKQDKKILSICGAGSRVLPLLGPDISEVSVLDVSEPQLRLLRLRISTLQTFSFDEYLQFWGYKSSLQARLTMLNSLPLEPSDRQYWLEHASLWKEGFLFVGKWESYLRQLGKLFRQFFFVDFESLFETHSIEERQQWYKEKFPTLRLQLFLKTFANPVVFNLFLYRGRFATSKESFSDFLMRVFHTLLIEKDPKQSFFAQMLFLGKLSYSQGWPIEAHEKIFNEAKRFQGKWKIERGDLVSKLLSDEKYDFQSLSDVASYLSTAELSQLEKRIPLTLTSDGHSVIRSFRRHPEFSPEAARFRQQELESWSEKTDSIGVYKFYIFSHNSKYEFTNH